MCNALQGIVQDQSVSMSVQTMKMSKTVTNVFNAKRAASFLNFLLRTRNQYLCCLAVTTQNALSKKRVVPAKMKTYLLFDKTYPPITIRNMGICAKKGRIIPFMA